MIKGQVIEVSLQPVLAKDLDAIERGAPIQVDMRNVRYTKLGSVVKRRGYAEDRDVGTEYPITALIPEGEGYAIDSNGSLFVFGESVSGASIASSITSLAASEIIPDWEEYDGSIYITYGSTPIKVKGKKVTRVPVMPNDKFIALVSDYMVTAGKDDTEFSWSASGNPENRDANDGAGTANLQKTGTLLNMINFRDRLFFFKPKEIELWNFRGAVTTDDSPFARYPGGKIDVGLGAVNSVVKTKDSFFWFGSDGDFYEYNGAAVNISSFMRARLDEMKNPQTLIGHDIRAEHCIRWVNHLDGVTFLYDYHAKKWLEDNRWEGSGWQSVPLQSYMELNRKQYYGSSKCDGKIYEAATTKLDDDGQPIRVFRSFKLALTSSGRKARVHKMQMRRKAPVATSSVSTPTVEFRWRFDNGDWSNSEHVSLGEVGSFSPYIERHRLGRGEEIEIEISEMDAVDFLITDILLSVEELKQ